AAQQRSQAPMVGRSREMRIMTQSWRQACRGTGQTVLLSGEPGIGKSRLIAALADELHNEQHARLRYFCSPYHTNSSLYPVTAQLERAAGVGRGEAHATKLDKLEALLRDQGNEAGEAAPLLAMLLSIDPAGRYTSIK